MKIFYFLFMSFFISIYSKSKDNPGFIEEGEFPIVQKDSIFHKCYYTCSDCLNNEPNETNHNCIECAENYYKLKNGLYPNNCYDNETIKNILILKEITYFNLNNLRKLQVIDGGNIWPPNGGINPQDIDTLDCPSSINSEECKNDNYPLIDSYSKCYNKSNVPNGYYLDTKCRIWLKCYSKCETCESKGNDTNMNCLSCKTQPNSDFKLINGSCIYDCLNNLFITPNGSCVLTCQNGTYQYSHNNSCLESCPNYYEINEDNNECVLKEFIEEITVSEL